MQDSRGDVNDCARLYGLALIADNHDAPARINEYDFIRIFVRVNRNPSHGVRSQRVPVALVIDCSIPVGENVARRLPLKDAGELARHSSRRSFSSSARARACSSRSLLIRPISSW